ncbi:hypothetical protein HPB50_014970 [Hyalomma asiaticum]|uniref:Uncharacterized protein n=1 Tax=Hyalomma asiaticum TaxID=266040 RepID=A0ACB7SSV5_HYAAI|nr:hypothetical protein HPB50_014970 [Hyalomma asiaticum]
MEDVAGDAALVVGVVIPEGFGPAFHGSAGKRDELVPIGEAAVQELVTEMVAVEVGHGFHPVACLSNGVDASDGDPATNQQSVAAYTMRAKHYVRKITKASRMRNLPTDDFKIVVRPWNGFNVSNYQKDRIHCCIHNTAGVGRDTAEEDSVCVNE